jgi:ketosteroid isomerase-like protein
VPSRTELLRQVYDALGRRDFEVLAVLRVRLQGRGSGVELDDRVAQLWTLRDGKLVRMRLRQDADAALAEFEAGG